MADDASLDDFLPTDESDDEQDDGDAADTETASEDGASETANAAGAADAETANEGAGTENTDGPAVEPSAVESATTTYGWSSEATDCERCGDPVDRRWRDGEALVCVECKEW